MSEKHFLGEGVLSWPRLERVSDRYGIVSLVRQPVGDPLEAIRHPPKSTTSLVLQQTEALVGLRGKLYAQVIETRQSQHPGDIAHAIRPRTPEVGDYVPLGATGTLVVERVAGELCVGVQPDDGRPQQWLDTIALYSLHDQTVRLWFEEAQPT